MVEREKRETQQVRPLPASNRGSRRHHGMRLHFGLGDCDRVERIEVRWLGGSTQVIEDVGADQLVVVVEGSLPGNEGLPR